MRKIGEQSVTDINRRIRDTAQRHADIDPRCRSIQTVPQLGRLQSLCPPLHEPGCRIANRTGDPDFIAEFCGIATQGLVFRNKALHGHGDRQRTLRRIAAHELNTMLIGQFKKAVEKFFQPLDICIRQTDRQTGPGRHRAHCGKVA